jgi:hypothetical protein
MLRDMTSIPHFAMVEVIGLKKSIVFQSSHPGTCFEKFQSLSVAMFSFNRLCLTVAVITLLLGSVVTAQRPEPRLTCIVEPCRDGLHDAPAIIDAFEICGKNGKVVFLNETYHIESIMNTTGLENCEIDLKGAFS